MGGAITIGQNSTVLVTGGVFTNNSAEDGGAIGIGNGNAEIRDCEIRENDATFGGAISIVSSENAVISNCDMIDNQAVYFGGGINATSAVFSVDDCRMLENICGGNGGAVYLYESDATFVCCEIVDNSVIPELPRNRNTAGGIILESGTARISASTIAGNGLAIACSSPPAEDVDARLNYWGHDSGPYHPLSNPDGQGDELGDHVLFAPWNTSTHVASDASGLYLAVGASAPGEAGISYFIPVGIDASLDILDVRGRRIRSLSGRLMPAVRGELVWGGRDDRGRRVASGIYLLRLANGEKCISRRLLLLR